MKKIMLTLAAVALTLPLFAGGPKDKGPAALKVISYNIRVGTANDGTNSWQYRYPASAMMIMDQKPDIFGLQEALDFQVKYLEDYCDGYKGVGVGRDDGRHEGEQMSIFYNTRNIKLLKWGTYWLSETPEKPSLGWDAVCKRTATWALMKDKRSGRHFYFINTHLDHKGKQARINGLQLIMDRIASMNPEDYPIIVTGDFNVNPEDICLDSINKHMQNARETAFKTDKNGTFNNWGAEKKVRAIDYIFYKGFSSCTEFARITKPYMERNFISDHYPVSATLVF